MREAIRAADEAGLSKGKEKQPKEEAQIKEQSDSEDKTIMDEIRVKY